MNIIKMNIIKKLFNITGIFLLSGFFACSEDAREGFGQDNSDLELDKEDFYYVVTNLPSYTLYDISTRADNLVNNISAFYYKSDNSENSEEDFISMESIVTYRMEGNNLSFYLPKVKDAKYVQVLVNGETDPEVTDLSKVFITHLSNNSDENLPIFWGKALLPLSGNVITELPLIHNDVKVSVEVSSNVTDFKLDETNSFGVFGSMTYGSLAPKDWNTGPKEPTLPEERIYGSFAGTDSDLTTGEVFIFETDADKAKIIIKGYYQGNEDPCYYTAGFYLPSSPDNSPKPIDLVRGHHYKLIIEGVNSVGWSNIDDALTASPDNRLMVNVTDVNDDIVDIISCRDYALGVNNPAILPATSSNGENLETQILIATSYSKEPVLSIEQNNWATLQTLIGGDLISGSSPTEYLYSVKVMALPNYESDSREATVTVRCGDLQRIVIIRQEGIR